MSLEAISQNTPFLRSTGFSGCLLIQGMRLFAPSLSPVKLTTTYFVDSAVIKLATRINSGLIGLNLAETAITDDGVIAIATNCPRLQILNIAFNSELTDASLFALAKHCRLLQVLDISHGTQFQDLAVATVIQQCIVLNTLNVSFNTNIGSIFFDAVTTRESTVPWIELNLTRCYQLEEFMLQVIKTKVGDGGTVRF